MADKSLHYPKGECSPLFGDEADGDPGSLFRINHY